jgi:hypothetical protein
MCVACRARRTAIAATKPRGRSEHECVAANAVRASRIAVYSERAERGEELFAGYERTLTAEDKSDAS